MYEREVGKKQPQPKAHFQENKYQERIQMQLQDLELGGLKATLATHPQELLTHPPLSVRVYHPGNHRSAVRQTMLLVSSRSTPRPSLEADLKWTILSAFLALWLLVTVIQGIRENGELGGHFPSSLSAGFSGKADALDSRSQFLVSGHLSMIFFFQFLVVTASFCPFGPRAGHKSGVFQYSL